MAAVSGAARPVIVYVEDDEETFHLAQRRLESRYEVQWARDDREACARFRAGVPRLCAVLVDVELGGAGLDGLQLVRLLRGTLPAAVRPPYAEGVAPLSVPLIIMTAYTARVSEADARALGASHLVTKPIDFTKLNLALAQANHDSVLRKLGRRDSLGHLPPLRKPDDAP